MLSAHDVAAALLDQLGPMTAKKLEKLAYYCQCWHLVRHGRPMFKEAIEAWAEGPVVRSLYQEHRGLYNVRAWPKGSAERVVGEAYDTVRWVCERYGSFPAERLSRMTHAEAPWRIARGTLPEEAKSDALILHRYMRDYYRRQIADVDTAVAYASANAALEGIELDTEWQERLRDVASGAVSANALIAEVIARAARR